METPTINTQTQVVPATRTLWQADPAHLLVEFSAKHMMFTTVRGRFDRSEVKLELGEDLLHTYVEASLDAASLNTGDERRDGHLRSADFLDAETYPTINFKSTRIESAGQNKFRMYGDLTIRDITREVALDVVLEGQGKSPWGQEVIAFSAETTINRKEWNLNWNVALETGGWLVGDNIKIGIHLEAIKPQPQEATTVH